MGSGRYESRGTRYEGKGSTRYEVRRYEGRGKKVRGTRVEGVRDEGRGIKYEVEF